MKEVKKRITAGNGYAFELERAEVKCNALHLNDAWYKWRSTDGRFIVCCDDTQKVPMRHALHIFLRGEFAYRPEVYSRNCDNTGNVVSIVVRRGSDNGGLHSLEEIDRYIQELAVTRKAVEAMQELFITHWDSIRKDIPLACADDAASAAPEADSGQGGGDAAARSERG